MAYADEDNGCQGNCPQSGGQEQAQGQAQGQLQGQAQGQIQSADANSSSKSKSTGVGIGVGQGGEGGSGGRGGSASSNATSGDSVAVAGGGKSSVGNVGAVAANGGNTTGDVSVSIGGDSYVEEHDYKNMPASSAAAVYAQVCQTGGSAQGRAGGISVVNSDVLCDHLKMASFYQAIAEYEKELGNNDKAFEYYAWYHHHVEDAETLMKSTEKVGLVDRLAGYLIRPMTLIGVLIWLL
jgi:hypothetical protein